MKIELIIKKTIKPLSNEIIDLLNEKLKDKLSYYEKKEDNKNTSIIYNFNELELFIAFASDYSFINIELRKKYIKDNKIYLLDNVDNFILETNLDEDSNSAHFKYQIKLDNSDIELLERISILNNKDIWDEDYYECITK